MAPSKASAKTPEISTEAVEDSVASDMVEVYFTRNYQPYWDANREPKPNKIAKHTFAVLPLDECVPLFAKGAIKRVSDMPRSEILAARKQVADKEAERARRAGAVQDDEK